MNGQRWQAPVLCRPGRRGLAALVLLTVAACASTCTAAERPPLHRASVPANRTAGRPAGDWQQVPTADLLQFARDYQTDAVIDVAPPLIDRLVFRGSLTEDSVLTGRFKGTARRFDSRAAFLELGRVTPAISAIEWSDRPAVWGSSPDGTALLYVDRDSDDFSGQWSQRGEDVLGGAEFDLHLFPAASLRIELTLPAAFELQSSRGVVLAPQSGDAQEQLWAIELGQQTACLLTVVPKSDRPPVVSMSVERSSAWSIRPDGCRLQADFNISIPASAPATLEFEIPDELQNPEVTTTSNVSLPAEVDRRSTPPRLIVPLPRLASGRLGTIRVSGDLTLRTDEHWTLPDVRLENSTVVNSIRRVHIDRPLKLLSLDLSGVRQTDINIEDSGGDWTFEDTSPEARVAVRIGRPPALLTLGAATLIELAEGEAKFRSAVELLSRSGGDYRAELWLPTGWNVIEVGALSGDRGAVTSWRTTETEEGVRLEIEFRQSVSSQTPRRITISGRRNGGPTSSGEIELFPTLAPPGETRVWMGIRSDGPTTASLVPRDGAQSFNTGVAAPEWSRLAAALGIADGDRQWSWFTQSSTQPAGGTIVWSPEAARNSSTPPASDATAPAVSTAADAGPFAMDLFLETETGGTEARWMRHRARYTLFGRRPDAPPKIRMPAGAVVDGLTIDGRPQNVITAGETIELLEWPAAPRSIELRYRTPNTTDPHWLSRRLDVQLPVWDVAPQSTEWRLQLPRTEQLSEVGVPCSAVLPRPDSGWMSRLFGPLGREHWKQTANPLSMQSWRARLWPQEQSTATSAPGITIRTPLPDNTLSVELANVPNIERAGWISIFGAVLFTALLRLWTRRGAALLGIAACLLLIGVGLFPYVAATLCGGVLTGVVIGALLPRQWLAPVRTVPEPEAGQSDITRVGVAIGAALLLLNAWHGQLGAQPTAPSGSDRGTPVAGDAVPAEFDLVVPETDGVAEEFALIQRRLLPLFERWQRTRHQNPAYLVQSARHALELGETPQVLARYSVAVFDRRPIVPLTLSFGRLSVADPDACRVDGAPAQIRPSTSSRAMLIELPGAEAGTTPPARIVDVELTLQLSAASRIGAGWEFEVPPVIDAEVSLPAGVEPQLTVDSEVEHAGTDGRSDFAIGDRSTVSVRPVEAAASSTAETLTADAVSLIEVHPLRLRVRTQLLPAPAPQAGLPSGSRRLRLVLPEQADVREVAVAGLRSYTVRHPQRDITLVELELDRWPASDAGIHLDFTLPVERSPEGIVIPPIPLLRDNRLQNHHIGLRAGPGMTLEPAPASRLPASLHEMPAEMFSSGLGTDTPWPVPSLVYVATSPGALTVDARPIRPDESVALEQTIVVGEDTLTWQATADIVIALAPTYQYEFELSAAVNLTAVALVEEGADRTPDWSHIGDRLVLYPPGDRIGRQKVRLTGTMQFDPNVITSLPVFKMRDADTTSSDLFIQSGPSRRLELFAADGSPVPMVAGGATSGTVQFTQQDAELPSAFRASPAPDPLSVTVVTTFDRHGDGWELSTKLIPARALANGETIQIDLPPELARSVTATEPAVIQRVDGGTVHLTLNTGRISSALTPLAFSLPVQVPDRGAWTAPRPKFPNTSVLDEFVVVPSEFPLMPSAEESTSVDVADWPVGSVDRPSQSSLLPPDAVYRWTGNDARFQDRNPADGAPDVHVIESTVWQDEHHRSGGETTFWITTRQSRSDIRFNWPAGVELRGAQWDGRSIELQQQTDADLEFRVEGLTPGALHRLTLTWSDARGVSSATGELWRPRWSRDTTAQEFAIILPRTDYILLRRPGQPTRSDILKLRADSLLNLASTAGATSRGESTAVLAGEIDAALAMLDRVSPTEVRTLRARQAALSPPFNQNSVAMTAESSLTDIAWRDPAALPVLLSNRAPEIRFWELHTRLTIAAAYLAGLLLVIVALRFRGPIAGVFGRLPVDPAALRVLALGSVWWTWFKFGAVGLLLLIASAVLQRHARNRAPSQVPTSPV